MTDSTSKSSPTELSGWRLTLVRLIWALLVSVSLALFALGMWDKSQAPLASGCHVSVCNPVEFTGDDVHLLRLSGISVVLVRPLDLALNLLFDAGFIIVALFLGWRRSNDWLALLLSVTLVILGGVAFSPANDVLYRTRPHLGPLVNGLQQPAYISLFLLLLIFPDGQFVPRRSTWVAIFMGLASLPILLSEGRSIEADSPLTIAYFSAALILVLYSQIYRYRRVSTPAQRQQTKWALLGMMSALMIMIVWSLIAAFFPPDEPTIGRAYALLAVRPIMVLVGLLMPLSFAIAILRYRLWDIDLIIRRTLQYTVLTGVLALLYFGGIVLLQSAFRSVTGQADSPLITVITTLAIAGLFTPVRRRVQEFVDRRFFRRKYDAAKTLARFAQTARDETDLDVLTADLLRVVQDTMQPERLLIWMKGPGRPLRNKLRNGEETVI